MWKGETFIKVKDFVQKIEELGYDDNTEIVFDLKNNDEDTYIDFYCQSIYSYLYGLNAIGIEISRNYK